MVKGKRTAHRTAELRVRVDPAIVERLKNIATLYGVPFSTLASLAIGQYVSQQEHSVGAIEKMVQAVGSQAGDVLKDAIQQMQQVDAFPER